MSFAVELGYCDVYFCKVRYYVYVLRKYLQGFSLTLIRLSRIERKLKILVIHMHLLSSQLTPVFPV